MQHRSTRDPGVAASAIARRPAAPRAPRGASIRSGRRMHGRQHLRGGTRRRGISGPSGPHHGHRSARRTERRVVMRSAGGAAVRSTRRICSDSSSICRRPASSSPKPGARSSAGRSSRSARPSGPAATWARWTCWWWIPSIDVDRVTDALLEEVLRSAQQQGLHRRRGGVARGPGGADPLGAVSASREAGPRIRTSVAAAGPPRARPMNSARRAALSAPAPRTTDQQGVICGQERRRLRGRGEHLLRGQGGRRGHRLRHAAEVGHGRARFRPRLRLHGAGPGQREPAQLPRLPAPAQLQGRQQGHPQVRRRQGQGEPRHRARRRHDEDRPQPRRRDRRVRRRRLRAGHPGRPGDGRPGARSSASAATPART